MRILFFYIFAILLSALFRCTTMKKCNVQRRIIFINVHINVYDNKSSKDIVRKDAEGRMKSEGKDRMKGEGKKAEENNRMNIEREKEGREKKREKEGRTRAARKEKRT